jgi:hypothetical protein
MQLCKSRFPGTYLTSRTTCKLKNILNDWDFCTRVTACQHRWNFNHNLHSASSKKTNNSSSKKPKKSRKDMDIYDFLLNGIMITGEELARLQEKDKKASLSKESNNESNKKIPFNKREKRNFISLPESDEEAEQRKLYSKWHAIWKKYVSSKFNTINCENNQGLLDMKLNDALKKIDSEEEIEDEDLSQEESNNGNAILDPIIQTDITPWRKPYIWDDCVTSANTEVISYE